MPVDPATFLTQVYCWLDQYCADLPRAHPGPPCRMSDSEVLTLLVVARFTGKSERGILRWAATALTPPGFSALLSQSAFNRRARRLSGGLATVLSRIATELGVADDHYEIVDGLSVPLAQRCRGERHRLFTPEQANVGRGGAGKGWYYGVSLLLSVSASGPITGCVVAPANTGERWALSALLTWRADPTALPDPEAALADRGARTARYVGPTGDLLGPAMAGQAVTGYYLADAGFRGRHWRDYWHQDLSATVMTAETLGPPLRHWFHHARQPIETVNALLTDVLHVRTPQARTQGGLLTRILAACVACNLGMLINRQLNRPPFALGTLCNV